MRLRRTWRRAGYGCLALLLLSVLLVAVVPYFHPVRIPFGGRIYVLDAYDTGDVPGTPPAPGWFSGPAEVYGEGMWPLPAGRYHALFGSHFIHVFLALDRKQAAGRKWLRPTRWVVEHPQARLLQRRVEAGSLTRAEVLQILGPPKRKRSSSGPAESEEWTYAFPGWVGGLLLCFDSQDRVTRISYGYA